MKENKGESKSGLPGFRHPPALCIRNGRMDSKARMSRMIGVLLVFALAVGVAACGGDKPQPPEDQAAAAAAAKAALAAAARQQSYPPGIPYEEVFPEDFEGIVPVRIGVLSSANRPAVGQRIALVLGGVQRRNLEWRLGKPVKVAFVSRSGKRHRPKTQIRYRPNFLEAAIHVADVIASKQIVRPMSHLELAYEDIDIFVYVGSGER